LSRRFLCHREEDEIGQLAQGLPRGTEDLEKSGIHVTSLGAAGEMLDEQAKAAYRRRLSELREELEEAKELGRVDRAEQAEEEIEALTRELSRAVGLGGRNRRAASASERAPTGTRWRERGEFELPVPISEQSDYKKMAGFAAPRRIVGIA
jgi:hypothetical protein